MRSHLPPARPLPLGALGILTGLLASLPASGQSQIYTLPSGAPGEQQGAALAFGGDLDGDGVPDLAVGAPGGMGNLGVVRVRSGDTGVLLATFVGSALNGKFGAAVALADVNADGRADVLVGAHMAGSGGSVSVYDGASGGLLYTLLGSQPGEHFGWSVVGLDDLSGDGFDDFAVGSIDAIVTGLSSGLVRVCSGADGATLYTLAGAAAKDQLGWALCALQDLDGDGIGDFAVSAPHVVQANNQAPGYVRLVSGASGAILVTLAGTAGNDAFGRALAPVADLDGDGLGDLAVGAPQPTAGNNGYARVFSSASGAQLLALSGLAPSDLFGASVAPAGDVDGDGVGDLAVGAPRANVFAGDDGHVVLFSGASGAPLGEFTHPSGGAHLGSTLAGGADVNGDGILDLLVGADTAPGGGSAQLLSTQALRLTADTHELSQSAGTALHLRLEAGAAQAGRKYLILGSISGAKPGTVFAGLGLPLNPDRYFRMTANSPATGPIGAQSGTLDAGGSALATFQPPQGAPLAGVTFRHAFVVYDAAGVGTLASWCVPVTLLP